MPTALMPRGWRKRPEPAAADAAGPQAIAARRAAYEGMAQRNEPALLRAARRLVKGDEDRAQDLVQDALVKAYQAVVAGRFAEAGSEKPWLLRIMTNGFINEYRRQAKWMSDREIDDLAEDPALHAADGDRPDVVLMAATFDEPLERALGSLSAEARACVILVDVEGLEYAEAAGALGVPVGTVRSRLSRARLQLHALLHGYARERGRA